MPSPRALAGARGALRPGRAFAALLALALGVALLVLARRGRDAPPAPFTGDATELLQRAPDQVFEQPGVLRPSDGDQWGLLGLSGWRIRATPHDDDGRARVDTFQPEATLSLPVVEAKDRTIALEMAVPEPTPGAPLSARVELNGVILGTVELAQERRSYELHAIASFWHLDAPNVLTIAAVHDADGPWNRIGAYSVAYGEERVPEVLPGEGCVTLAPATGVAYQVEPLGRSQLVLRGTAQGAGSLELAFEPVDARTGDPATGERTTASVSAAALAAGQTAPLPTTDGRLLRIEARWRGTGSVDLERLAVVAAEDRPRPPVVFISIDTFAASHLSVYGYPLPTTPRLAELAQDSVVFDRCLSNAPWTMPSYLSVMSGLFPSAHQMKLEAAPQSDLDAWDTWQIAENRWTMAEMLRGAGYLTAGWIDTDWLLPKFRIDQGFESYNTDASKISVDDWKGGIALIEFEAKKWIAARRPDEPFFLFVHALDSHGPYLPGPDWVDRFHRDPPPGGWTMVPADSAFQTYRAIPHWMALTLHPHDAVPESLPLEPIVERYDECILKTDQYIGAILDDLRAQGLYDRSLIVVTGDHGESFAHDFYSHGAMWEDIEHVPLIVKMPGGEAAGEHVARTVSLVDLYPTLRELLGLPAQPWLAGESLLPLVRDPSAAHGPVFSEEGHCRQYMVSDDDWKLIVEYPAIDSKPESLFSHPRIPLDWLRANAPELVDHPLTDARMKMLRESAGYAAKEAELRQMLAGPFVDLYSRAKDPGELHDVAAQHPDVCDELQRDLRRFQAEAKRTRDDARPVPTTELSSEEMDRLRKLGYAGDGDVERAHEREADPPGGR